MRQSPQYIVPLLLFLIVVLLGALVWLQLFPGFRFGDDQSDRKAAHPGGLDLADGSAEDEGDNAPATNGPRDNSGRPVPESDNRVERPGRIEEEKRPGRSAGGQQGGGAESQTEEARRKAALEALLAGSAMPRVADLAGPEADLGARVQWIVPPLKTLGLRTPDSIKGEGLIQGKRVPTQMLEDLADAGYDVADTSSFSLLAGRVEMPEMADSERALWAPLKGPPVVVTFHGQRVIANSEGRYAVTWRGSDAGKREAAISVSAAGFRMADSRESVPVDPGALGSDKGVTLKLERAPFVVFTVNYSPAQVLKCDVRAWLEIWAPEQGSSPRWSQEVRSPGLFITSPVPKSGTLTFMFPDPRSWTDRPVRFGATADGWGISAPRRLDLGDKRRGPKRADVKEDPVTYLRGDLKLDRAYTEKVTGRAQQDDSEEPGNYVRIEGSHTGVVTWTDAKAAFAFHLDFERGNWRQDLRVEMADGSHYTFDISQEDRRLPFARLASSGRAPAGEWILSAAKQPETAKMVPLYVPRPESGRSYVPQEIWFRGGGGLYALVMNPNSDVFNQGWYVPDVLGGGGQAFVKFYREGVYLPAVLTYGEIPAHAMRGATSGKPAEGKPAESEKEESAKPMGWTLKVIE